jgi:hypothetical protein
MPAWESVSAAAGSDTGRIASPMPHALPFFMRHQRRGTGAPDYAVLICILRTHTPFNGIFAIALAHQFQI